MFIASKVTVWMHHTVSQKRHWCYTL